MTEETPSIPPVPPVEEDAFYDPSLVWSDKQIQKIKIILDGLKNGLFDQNAAQNAGVSRITFWSWQKKDPIFAAACEYARSKGVSFYTDLLKVQAEKGNVTAIKTWLESRSDEFKADQMDKKTEEALMKLLSYISNHQDFGLLPPKQNLSELTVTDTGIKVDGSPDS